MAVIDYDTRLAEADRLMSIYERDNVPTKIARELLPALLSPGQVPGSGVALRSPS